MLVASPRIELVVIQPSPFCNIDCRYCYLAGRASTQIMDEHTLAKIYERLFASAYLGETICFLWHAGEPLSVPIAFYEKAFALVARFNRNDIRIQQVLQTNGTLITQQWCDFFKTHEVHVSVSIDGPQHLHDAQRVTRQGRGTFDRAMQGMKLMQKNGIPINNLAVLTCGSLDYPDEIWEFFLKHGITRLAFNVEQVEGIHTQSSMRPAEDALRYQAFFRRVRELRRNSGEKVFVRELDKMEDLIRGASEEPRELSNIPLAILNFDCDGNISTFSPELLAVRNSRYQTFKFGNVHECGVDDILASEHFRAARDDIQRGVAKCRETCPYFSVCGGGEPSNKLAENGTFDSTETMNCRLVIQALCDVVLEGVEQELGIVPAPPVGSIAVAPQGIRPRGGPEETLSAQ